MVKVVGAVVFIDTLLVHVLITKILFVVVIAPLPSIHISDLIGKPTPLPLPIDRTEFELYVER